MAFISLARPAVRCCRVWAVLTAVRCLLTAVLAAGPCVACSVLYAAFVTVPLFVYALLYKTARAAPPLAAAHLLLLYQLLAA